VLETGQFQQLGSSHTRNSKVRILSATNTDLPLAIRQGRFREDLFYRLNAVEIAVPPLAERSDDILTLAQHFLGEDLELSEEAAASLLAHDWPGNVRELRNSIERARLLVNGRVVSASDLSLPPPAHRAAGVESDTVTREMIEASLSKARGNISRAAQSLGLSRQALYRRMERLGIKS
jgi:DNA-binding NtrC family response regulator